MNLISCITNLLDKPDDIQRTFIDTKDLSFKEELLLDQHCIKASDLFLKEIELLVENIDSIIDKHNVQILLTKFEEIEMELDERHESKVSMIKTCEVLLSDLRGWNEARLLAELKEAKKVQSLISELKERKSKVDQRLKELGIKFYFK
jgi:translation initiation factor 2B subunit (eIF-2B alpha/beta/delta family)